MSLLDVVRIELLPLRDRREEIPVPAQHFLRRYEARCGREIGSLPGRVLRRPRTRFVGGVRPGGFDILQRACAHSCSGFHEKDRNILALRTPGGIRSE